MFIRRITLLLMIATISFFGCGDKDETSQIREVYFGRYIAGNLGEAMPRVDSVELTIQDGAYTLFLEKSINEGNLGGWICGNNGKIDGFPGRVVRFTPTYINDGNCDTIRVPRGSFYARYHGDSVILTDTSEHTYEVQQGSSYITKTDSFLLVFELSR